MNDAFAQRVLGLVSSAPWSGPRVFFNSEGDCIELLLSNDSSRARRLDALVTVHENRESGDLVGALEREFAVLSARSSSDFQASRSRSWTARSNWNTCLQPGYGKTISLRIVRCVKTYQKHREAAEQALLEVELEAV